MNKEEKAAIARLEEQRKAWELGGWQTSACVLTLDVCCVLDVLKRETEDPPMTERRLEARKLMALDIIDANTPKPKH